MAPEQAGKKKLATVDQVSAGGVAFRRSGGRVEVVICNIMPERRWQLPKGLIDEGETVETAAVREVREEAGVDAEIVATLDKIEYWFIAHHTGERARYHKRVHFFLMNYLSGDVADHDHEVAEARWVPIDEAVEMLSFKSEREIVEAARRIIGFAGD
jgi:8-oxo-dGTP pyrophosphatase MutT (NUDIX family)